MLICRSQKWLMLICTIIIPLTSKNSIMSNEQSTCFWRTKLWLTLSIMHHFWWSRKASNISSWCPDHDNISDSISHRSDYLVSMTKIFADLSVNFSFTWYLDWENSESYFSLSWFKQRNHVHETSWTISKRTSSASLEFRRCCPSPVDYKTSDCTWLCLSIWNLSENRINLFYDDIFGYF